MRRKFRVWWFDKSGGEWYELVEATDHRNAVQLLVNKYQLPSGTEVHVIERPQTPHASTYIVWEHTSREIEMKT